MNNNTVPHNIQNNQKEIERMINEYGDSLLRMCCLYMGNMPSAEDALQETYIRAFKNLDRFRHQCSEKTWLTGIAINVCRSLIRSEGIRRKHIISPENELNLEQIPQDEGSEIIYDDTVLREIHKLKPKYREVVLMYYYQEMKAKEIADILGISESAVTVRLSRAREQLKEKLSEWYYD